MSRRLSRLWPAVFLLAGLWGCGASGPRTYEVTGTVTFDDQPVTRGDIYFHPEDGRYGSEHGAIVEGKYRAKVKEGKHKVTIQASRPVPGKKGPMGEDAIEDYIPPQFADVNKTELSADVGPGKTEFNFPLKSK
jgi:hypothetical protein